MKRKKKYRLTQTLLTSMAFALMLCSPSGAWAQDSWPQILRAQMQRTADVSYRLSRAAEARCPIKGAAFGLTLDYFKAYEEKDRGHVMIALAMSEHPQIASVAAGSPSQRAGLQAGDDLLAIDGLDVFEVAEGSEDGSLLADELERKLGSRTPSTPIELTVRRNGAIMQVNLQSEIACAARVVIKTELGITAFSDGTNIAISSKLINFSKNDDELALVIAHELGHVINQDGDVAGLQQRRAMEDRADAVGIVLVKCAGYDVDKALQFWVRRDAQDWLRLLRAPTHRSRGERVKLMRAVAANAICRALPDEGG